MEYSYIKISGHKAILLKKFGSACREVVSCTGSGYDVSGMLVGKILEKYFQDNLQIHLEETKNLPGVIYKYLGEVSISPDMGRVLLRDHIRLEGACGLGAIMKVAKASGIFLIVEDNGYVKDNN